MFKQTILLGFLAILALTGCTRTQKVVAMSTDVTTPYQEIGILEIFLPAHRFTKEGVLFTGVEVATLTFADTPTRGQVYQKKLLNELASVAKKNYGADAVVRAEFWPDPESDAFPEGKIYARGMMIKYSKFEES